MSTADRVERVRIYIGEQDMWEQKPLYLAVLTLLQREGATGATALHGLAGFGPGDRSRAAGLSDFTANAPIVIEWIDHADRVAQLLPLLDEMLPATLISTEEVQIFRAVMRSQGPFAGDQNVGDIMQSRVQTIGATGTLGKAINLMLTSNQTVLPVVDDQQHVVGVVDEVCLARRGGLKLPLRLIPLLTKEEGVELIGQIASRSISEVMDSDWRSVLVSSFIPQALVLMIEWDDEQLVVLNRDDSLAGILGWYEVFSAFVAQAHTEESAIRDADNPTPVSLVMQSNVPVISLSQPLGAALQQLLASPDRYLVVVDQARRVYGSISAYGAFRRLSSEDRAPLIAALQQGTLFDVGQLSEANRSLEMVLDRDIPTIAPEDSIVDAVRSLMEFRVDRAPVLDEDGKLQGLIARGGLLRALVQESR